MFYIIENMNLFLPLYKEFEKNKKYNTQGQAEQFYNQSLKIAQTCNDISEKETILEKLLEIFPNDPAIFYYIGFANKTYNPEKSLVYHQKSYDINPNNIENLIDLCDLLLKFEMKEKVNYMNRIQPFGKFLEDWRLVVIYYQCIREISIIKCLDYIQYVISYLTNKGCHTEKEKEVLVSAYTHMVNMYSSLSNNKKALEIAERGIRLLKTYKMDTTTHVNTITTALFCSNFSYLSNPQQYKPYYTILNQVMPIKTIYEHKRVREPNKKIKIGYLSSDFTGHAVSNFIIPIIQNHNQDIFEVILFPNNIRIDESMLDIGAMYYNIFKLKDKEAADLIYSLEIDILIELNGYTGNSRLELLSYKSAPIQISYIGYPNTLGLDFVQYRITDAIADPIDTTQYYSETLLRLPKCFLIYQPWHQTQPVIPRKTKEKIILGSLNKENKTSPEVLQSWKKILHECPNTILLIKLDTVDDKIARLTFYKEHLHVEENRLMLITKTDKDAYNRLFSMIDILLDTFPYSGTTTTCNALYNSIPVVTMCKPNCHAHNVSTSLLKNIGLDELVTYSIEEYINTVKSLTNDITRIDVYKNTIREKFTNLMNPIEFMKSYEELLISCFMSNNTLSIVDNK